MNFKFCYTNLNKSPVIDSFGHNILTECDILLYLFLF